MMSMTKGRTVPISKTVAVVTHGIGNIRSLTNALDYLNYKVEHISSLNDIGEVDAVILPGVGNFGAVMRAIEAAGLQEFLQEYLLEDKPFLGVCVGMQVLLEGSLEAPSVPGFGAFSGSFMHLSTLDPTRVVPSIGWNHLTPTSSPASAAVLEQAYFTHSYFASKMNRDEVISTYDWNGFKIPAHIAKGRVHGVQFHPEKGRLAGLEFIRNTLEDITI